MITTNNIFAHKENVIFAKRDIIYVIKGNLKIPEIIFLMKEKNLRDFCFYLRCLCQIDNNKANYSGDPKKIIFQSPVENNMTEKRSEKTTNHLTFT